MLPENYAHALKALKDQANAATDKLQNRKSGGAGLKDAQQRMSQYSAEVRNIVRLMSRASLTIDTITEDNLSELLALP